MDRGYDREGPCNEIVWETFNFGVRFRDMGYGTLGLGGSGCSVAGVGRLRWIGHKCSLVLQYLLPWAPKM